MYNLGEVQLLRNLHVTHCPNFINASKIYMHMQMKITEWYSVLSESINDSSGFLNVAYKSWVFVVYSMFSIRMAKRKNECRLRMGAGTE